MKKSEIKVGVEYAYSQRSASGRSPRAWESSARKVIITGEPYSKRVPNSTTYGYRSITVFPATQTTVASRIVGGDEVGTINMEVEARHLHEEWAPFNARKLAEAERNREHAIERSAGQRQRAQSLLDIIPALRHKGLDDTRAYVYDKEVRALIVEFVPDIIDQDDPGAFSATILCPLAGSMGDYIRTGASFTLRPSDMMLVLGL